MGKRGAIVNVGSLCGEHAGICGTMYTSSKFATQGFSKQAAAGAQLRELQQLRQLRHPRRCRSLA